GDLVATGGEITINGTVEGDLIAAGGSITVNGTVQDDVRIAGGVLTIGPNAQIGDDVLAAGYSFDAASGSAIGGGLLIAGYQAKLAGDIQEDVNAATGALEIAGHIGGNVEVKVGEPDPDFERMQPFFAMWMPAPMTAPGFRLGDEAVIEGELVYTSGAEAEVASGAKVSGGIVYQTPVPRPEEAEEVEEVTPAQVTPNWFLSQLRRLITLLVVGLLLLWIVPEPMREAAAALQAKPLPGLGWGIVVIIVVLAVIPMVPIGVIVLAIILGRLGLGGLVASVTGLGLLTDAAILVGFLITALYTTKVIFGFLAGRLLLERIQPKWAAGRVLPLVIGVVIFVILRAIPYLGWLIGLVVTLSGLGALWLISWKALRRRRAAPA
ncbi:MAG: hypothetical protein U9R11_00675, partial [Chloroflexota bacterium]|nr:hypothetical protein [Chloroflexota bacterium]